MKEPRHKRMNSLYFIYINFKNVHRKFMIIELKIVITVGEGQWVETGTSETQHFVILSTGSVTVIFVKIHSSVHMISVHVCIY